LVPIVAGVFAILVAAPVLASATGSSGAPPASGGSTSGTATSKVRAQEWWLADLHTAQAWHISEGAGITVAVLSTGVSATQPDLTGAVITGPDYTASGRYSGGPYWGEVGTAVASIIAGHGHGHGDNSGIIGVAPQAKILSVRVTLEYNDPLNATTAITGRLPGAIADGITYAVNHGAKVIDLPLDAGTFGLAGDAAAAGGSAAERSAVRYALGKGVVLIAPGGDNAAMPGQASYPAAYPGVLAVGATGRKGQLASFSSRNSYVSLDAPGVDLLTASVLPSQSFGYGPGYAPISTTSAASAVVAGVAGLIVSKYPQLPVSDVVRALRSSTAGGTEVNAARALSEAATLAPHVRRASVRSPTPTPSPAKPHRTARPATTARPAAGLQASTVLRDAVLGVCGLVLLLAAFALVTRTRRNRAERSALAVEHGAGFTGHGLHEHRRGRTEADSPAGSPLAGGSLRGGPATRPSLAGRSLAGGSLPGGPMMRPSLTGGSLADRPMAGASVVGGSLTANSPATDPLTGDPLTVDPLAARSLATGWPTATNWPGTGPGEIAHFPATSGRPLLAPAPKSLRPGPAEPGSASPPWAPAAEPGSQDTPEPVMPSGWLPVQPASGIRLPPDIPEAPPTPGGFDGPDLTAPFAGRDVLTQSSYGFAAAPVPDDLTGPADVPPPTGFPAPTDFSGPAGFPAPTEAFSDPEDDQPDGPA
jgi:Subtilase family